ncbi:phage holin family protein [Alkalihalobacillus oceani]|uniref:phage holin family protein n=1 Tax=Halalkalibacter oceani TaxID=1653776 RepID=UPI00203BB5F4|nr:phage holin family protein [Halalkalibacter oceani]MCM3761027.1 phage holin family protein [Halalkalibacter oceani]
MKDTLHILQLIFTAIGGYIGWFLGGFDGLIYALIVFVAIDYMTGLMVAVLDKKLSSRVGFKGIFKKVLIFAFVGIGHIVDLYILEKGSAVRTAVIFFYLSNEALSIIENASKVGLPVPEKLKLLFQEMHAKEDKK